MNSEKIAKTYKLDKNLVKTFKNLCESRGKSQSNQLEMLMNNYINTYNILFEKADEGQINISSVGNLIDFLSKFPENMQINTFVRGLNYDFDSYQLKNGELIIYSNFANVVTETDKNHIEGVKNTIRNLYEIL